MTHTLYVINPNASEAITQGIRNAVTPLAQFGITLECVTNENGPQGIESQVQADLTVPQTIEIARNYENSAAGFVIACFGDPGLHALRDRTRKPVLGIQESAILTAMSLGQSFGIIAILQKSVPRHLRSINAMGVHSRLAGDRALNLGVADLQDEKTTLARMIDVGTDLRDRDGADVLIMGCAGMAQYKHPLEDVLGLPVVEPCQAAVSLALPQIILKNNIKLEK